MPYKVVHLSEAPTADLFRSKDELLGDGKGSYLVMDGEGIVYGRYVQKEVAQEHADNLNDPIPLPDDFDLVKFLSDTQELIDETRELLGDLNKGEK